MLVPAIILCAGKGTRMNDNSKNKVCFDCAGTPVIKRIIENMKQGGINFFVIVVGYMAESVMACLDGMDGIIYAYQKEQKGTGDALLCGLKELRAIGYNGHVIVSMGDKVISPDVIKGLINARNNTIDQNQTLPKAVLCVQPLEFNPNGGHVIIDNNRLYGIVEMADAALLAISSLPKKMWFSKLQGLGLNEHKAIKVIEKATNIKTDNKIILNDKSFDSDTILSCKYANTGLYSFDVDEVLFAIDKCNSKNAQGEVYLTDTFKYFSQNNSVTWYCINEKKDILTYSTKEDLSQMNTFFMKSCDDFINDINDDNYNDTFINTYGKEKLEETKNRYLVLLDHFKNKFGNEKIIITRSPGRVNLMGRHIDHRGGSINVMVVDRDTILVASRRNDDIVNITNVNSDFTDASFSINKYLSMAESSNWLEYLNSKVMVDDLNNNKGHWSNYVKAAFLRFAFENITNISGMDIAVSGNIPIAAGLSSSSSIVVATAEAINTLNCVNLDTHKFIDLCGEGEWFVGSRGGAGDHAAMKCCKKGKIIRLGFKPFEIGESTSILDDYAVIVADSNIKAKKSEGSKDVFNAKVAAYEIAFMLLKRQFPQYDLNEFRDLAKIKPSSDVYKMLLTLPLKMTREEIIKSIPEQSTRIKQIFANHKDPLTYDIRGVALFGISECARANIFMHTLEIADYNLVGNLMKISHEGDKIKDYKITDEFLKQLITNNNELYLQSGDYGCSIKEIDEMCDILNTTEGVIGSELVGAGLGGCVVALVEKAKADKIINELNLKYYDKHDLKRLADVYLPNCGSSVIF